jgi:hypothetical protein
MFTTLSIQGVTWDETIPEHDKNDTTIPDNVPVNAWRFRPGVMIFIT